MNDVQFAADILERLRERDPRFDGKAYLFLLSALQWALEELDEPRHVTGPELAIAVRELAMDEFGPLARTVLEHWGVHATEHIGEIVYALVEAGVLVTDENDRPEDFRGVFDFEEAFEQEYPWSAGD